MLRFRFRYKLSTMMAVVALSAVLLVYLMPPARGPDRSVSMFGAVTIHRDGTIEVRGGGVRLGDVGGTEVRANHLILKPSGTLEVFGSGSIKTLKK